MKLRHSTCHEKQRNCFRIGIAATDWCRETSRRPDPGPGRRLSGCPPGDRCQVDGPASAQGQPWSGGETDSGTTAVFDPGPGAGGATLAGGQADCPRLTNRPVDGPARGRSDPSSLGVDYSLPPESVHDFADALRRARKEAATNGLPPPLPALETIYGQTLEELGIAPVSKTSWNERVQPGDAPRNR